jgi:hypothetical protein
VATALTVPGVYFEPRPRVESPSVVRTDIAGFIGFETRIRDGTTSSALVGTPATGHGFRIDVPAFEVAIDGRRVAVPAAIDFVLSADSLSTLLADGESVTFGVVVVAAGVRPLAVKGVQTTGPHATPPGDLQLEAAARTVIGRPVPLVRLADIEVFRNGDAAQLHIVHRYLRSGIRNGTLPSTFTGGSPPTGHGFQVDVDEGEALIDGETLTFSAQTNLVLSSDPLSTLLAPGERIVFSLIGIKRGPQLVSMRGTIAPPSGVVASPPDDQSLELQVAALLGGHHRWLRLANIEYRRATDSVRMTVHPSLPPTCCDDYQDYLHQFGQPAESGLVLSSAVQAYFANGGRTCWITTVRAVRDTDHSGLVQALEDFVGQQGESEQRATGLERLLLIEDVGVVDIPDLYARRSSSATEIVDVPGTTDSGCFRPCNRARLATTQQANRKLTLLDPLFTDAEVFAVQRRMVERLIPERWRMLLLLSAPLERDVTTGRFAGPSIRKAIEWRNQFVGIGTPEEMSVVAMYFPWVLYQKKIDGMVVEMPPAPFAAGVIARRDLARGPGVSPANQTLRAVVGLTHPIDDAQQTRLHAPPVNINVLRSFPGYGVQVWGARTLSSDRFLRYLSARRALSAIERRASVSLQSIVFEPNSPVLWFRVSQLLFSTLLGFFNQGVLRGEEPKDAFFVRCDASNNSAQTLALGQLQAEVGVALTAPAEFIVFRVGRREGLIEVVE